jgi:hypothetical protein
MAKGMNTIAAGLSSAVPMGHQPNVINLFLHKYL